MLPPNTLNVTWSIRDMFISDHFWIFLVFLHKTGHSAPLGPILQLEHVSRLR